MIASSAALPPPHLPELRPASRSHGQAEARAPQHAGHLPAPAPAACNAAGQQPR